MRTGGGAEKGARWERECSKRLSLWVTNGKRDDCFWRTAMSGGRATFLLRQDIINRAQAGDMTAISLEGIDLCERYVWECKHRANLNFTGFMTNNTGLLAEYWRVVKDIGKRLDKHPALIAKQDRYPAMVFFPIGRAPFDQQPWAVFPRLNAEMYDFETVTAVFHKRPRGINVSSSPIRPGDDQRPIVLRRNGSAEAR